MRTPSSTNTVPRELRDVGARLKWLSRKLFSKGRTMPEPDLSKIVVYTYTASADLELPASCLEAAKDAIHAAHGYTPKPYEEAPPAVNAALRRLPASQGAMVTIDVFADGRRRVRRGD